MCIGGPALGAWVHADAKFVFTSNHDECECCINQVKRMTEDLKKVMIKYPDFPEEMQKKHVECCCHNGD
tara:strand:- start:1084 stop:1290 length:207 start_codon:yes stop_codon:yes gene_type:complete